MCPYCEFSACSGYYEEVGAGHHYGVHDDVQSCFTRLDFLTLCAPPPHTHTEEGEYFLKVLIPSYAAGSIIGKGGQTIVQLQKETGATIKLSKSKDFYPGKN